MRYQKKWNHSLSSLIQLTGTQPCFIKNMILYPYLIAKKCSSPFKVFSNYSDNTTLIIDQKTNFKLSILLLSLCASILLLSECSPSPKNSSYQNTETLQEGDLLFQDLNCGELCDAIEAVTEGVNGKDFSHCAMVVKINDSLKVVEAIGDKVQVNTLKDFFARSGDTASIQNITVGRVLEKYQPIVAKAATKVKEYIGQPYDDVFLMDNNSSERGAQSKKPSPSWEINSWCFTATPIFR